MIQIVKDKGRIWISDSNLNRQYAVIFIKFGPTLNTPIYIKCKKRYIQNHPEWNPRKPRKDITQETLNITQKPKKPYRSPWKPWISPRRPWILPIFNFTQEKTKIPCVKVPRITWISSRKLWIWPELKTLERWISRSMLFSSFS